MTSYERTGWRDQAISNRHRNWGFNCPAVDLDFVVVEYNIGKAVAVIEYKCYGAEKPNIKHPTYRALIDLCNSYRKAPLPFMIVFYCNEDWWFKVYPVNSTAREFYTPGQVMSEKEYVTSLYDMRKLVIEDSVLRKLSDIKPAFSVKRAS